MIYDLPCENSLQSMTITSGDVVLGMIGGCTEVGRNIVPKDPTGAKLCGVARNGPNEKFIVENEWELGKAGYFDGSSTFEIRLSPRLDIKSKATLLIAGYWIVSYCSNYRRRQRIMGPD